MSVADADALRDALRAIDGRSYGEYRRVARRTWALGDLDLTIEHAQGDPFASPSRIRVDVSAARVGLPRRTLESADARRACADFLHRALIAALRRDPAHASAARPASGRGRSGGSGGSGSIDILRVGQEVLARSAVVVKPAGAVCLRLTVGLPASGRRILGRAAADLLVERLPRIVLAAVGSDVLDRDALHGHVETVLDQVALREQLEEHGLVAFLAEGSILPRASGVDDRPLREAIPLSVPEAFAVELNAPHRGPIRGLGIGRGVTLIAGGGYHGKSTLLEALARSVYDHVPADGRELCVTDAAAVCIRAEDGRAVHGVDLRPFIQNLPLGRSTERFETADASGSTSQAAAIVEALEVGATALLIDEDTAATNFMIRDARMRRLVPPEREPITPFIDRVRQLHEERGVSSILVVGGAGDYLDVADRVVLMDTYRPRDATERARGVAGELPLAGDGAPQAPGPWAEPSRRCPRPASFDPRRGRRAERVRSRSTRAIEFGAEEIDLSAVAQIVDAAQCRFIGDVLSRLSRGLCDGRRSLPELLDEIEADLLQGDIDEITEPTFGDRAEARRFEVAAAINRLRSLRIVGDSPDRGGTPVARDGGTVGG